MTVVIIQCRLNSTRLPQKALLPLDGKPMITWTFEAMRKIEADYYYLATDKNSSNELRPIASACGWNVYAGSEENVLQRFCDVIKLTNADTVVRATGDNPFLFYEAAVESLNAFRKYDCDYFTFTGLPHGSGIEVFKASALLKANEKITDMTEREHVGPAIYQYKDEYKVVFEPSSAKYEYPIYRTTVDTYEDYLKATRIVRFLQNKYSYLENPYEAKYIIEALSSPMVNTPLLLIPSVKKGRGTGHFRRCSALAKISGAHIYVPKENVMSEVVDLIKESGSKLTIINDLPKNDKYSIYITDYFKLTKEEAIKFSEKTSLIAIDEGSEYTDYCDFLLDIIPSLKNTRKANYTNPAFIELPKNRKLKTAEKSPIKSVLIALGGEDPASLSKIAALACEKAGLQVTQLVKPIPDLREELYKYDLVMTHYGFTAFEAVAAGCAVILLETSKLHKKLAKKYGFAFIGKKNLNEFFVKQNIKNSKKLYVSNEQLSAMFDDSSILAMYLNTLSTGTKYKCPLNDHCVKKEFPDKVISRTPNKTIRRCQKCGILYVSWNMQAEKKYEKNYFFREYLNQYGKTYLEDFASIKLQGKRRLKNIYNIDKNKKIKNILDIGCAYGAFLSAAKDTGLKAFGLDIASDPVEYVNKELKIPAVCRNFPKVNVDKEFGIKLFDVITMWFVIEHFSNLDAVLRKVNELLPIGGFFAFSTPSASGISAKFDKEKFFTQSPGDHFTLWEPSRSAMILKKYGFKVKKIVSTGHHPERLPISEKAKNNSFVMAILNLFSQLFKMGDTCEIYCIKTKDINE